MSGRNSERSNVDTNRRQQIALGMNERALARTQEKLLEYQRTQQESLAEVMNFAIWLTENGHKVRMLDSDLVDSIDIPASILNATPAELAELRRLGPGVLLGLAVAAASRQGAVAAVT